MSERPFVGLRGVVAAALVSAAASTADGQCTPGGPPNPAWVKRAIVGIVLDQNHRVIENADVIIRSPRRQAKTDLNGRFRLADLDTGIYELTVRRFGYEVAVQSYQVTDSGGGARFCLVAEPRGLPAMITSALRAGLSGLVGDSTYKPLAGAEVRALGSGQHTLTDSAGGFHLPLNKGTYPVVVSKAGYARHLLSVTIPEDSGRQVAVWLGAPLPGANLFAQAIDDMRTRILWSSPNRSALMSSEQLAKLSTDLRGAAQVGARSGVNEDCWAWVDGRYRLPLYMIDKDDVALMEVYLNGSPRRTIGSIDPGGTGGGRGIGLPNTRGGPPVAAGGCSAAIYLWLKP